MLNTEFSNTDWTRPQGAFEKQVFRQNIQGLNREQAELHTDLRLAGLHVKIARVHHEHQQTMPFHDMSGFVVFRCLRIAFSCPTLQDCACLRSQNSLIERKSKWRPGRNIPNWRDPQDPWTHRHWGPLAPWSPLSLRRPRCRQSPRLRVHPYCPTQSRHPRIQEKENGWEIGRMKVVGKRACPKGQLWQEAYSGVFACICRISLKFMKVIVAVKDKTHHLFCSHPNPRLAVLKEFWVQPPALPENRHTKIFEFQPAIQCTFLKVFLHLIFLRIYIFHRVAVDFVLAFWMYPCVQIGAIPGFANSRSFRKFLNPLNECRWCRILRKNMDTLLVERASNNMKRWTLDYTTYIYIRQQCVQKKIRARGWSIG